MTEAFSIDGYVGDHPMLQLLDEIDERLFSKGDVVNGTLMIVGSNEILIDVGGKSEGILSPREVEPDGEGRHQGPHDRGRGGMPRSSTRTTATAT